MSIRKAKIGDLSRIGEIYVFNNRMNFYPIFKDKKFSFGELSVLSLVDNYFKEDEVMKNIYVFEDEIIKGFIQINEKELCKIYVDTFFQNEEVGKKLIEYAISEFKVDNLWVLEKNPRGISFYKRHGFYLTGEKKLEEDTIEYLLRMRR